MLSNLSPRQEYLFIELARQATFAEKITQVRWLSAIAAQRSREEIARSHPELSQEELKLKFIDVHYGKDLADKVRRYLDER